MATEALISWNAPAHIHTEKKPDWYWTVGIITLALAVVAVLFDQIITGIFIVVAATTLVLLSSKPPRILACEINDRGIMVDDTLYPFLSLESFWIPHDEFPDPEQVREILLSYIAETEHHESFLKKILEAFGF